MMWVFPESWDDSFKLGSFCDFELSTVMMVGTCGGVEGLFDVEDLVDEVIEDLEAL